MARKPIHWILRTALGFALPVFASAALADNGSMPSILPAEIDRAVTHAAAQETSPSVIGHPTEASPLTAGAKEETASSTTEETENGVEVIRERYPNSTVKVERHVTQDSEGNYYNHGLWTEWDEKGRLIGSGEYRYGKRQGRWLRWYGQANGSMFEGPLYKDFAPPFVGEATFEDGVLNGTWKIFDSKNRKVSEWEFDHGDRNGKSVWYYPTGQKHREVDYKQGQIDGDVVEYGTDSKVSSRDKYVDGRRLAAQTDYYSPGQKRAEGWILYAKEVTKSNYDFWDGVAATQVTGAEGANQRHGLWTWWHKNGQKQMEGRYENDMPIGKFTWWYPNGQKQLQGDYLTGKQQGKFTWWHANGQKQLEGAYVAGVLTAKWTRWNAEGHVVEVGDYTADGKQQQLAQEPRAMPSTEEDASSPSIETAQPITPSKSSRFKR